MGGPKSKPLRFDHFGIFWENGWSTYGRTWRVEGTALLQDRGEPLAPCAPMRNWTARGWQYGTEKNLEKEGKIKNNKEGMRDAKAKCGRPVLTAEVLYFFGFLNFFGFFWLLLGFWPFLCFFRVFVRFLCEASDF